MSNILIFLVFIKNQSRQSQDFNVFARDFREYLDDILLDLQTNFAKLRLPNNFNFDEQLMRNQLDEILQILFLESNNRQLTFDECFYILWNELVKKEELSVAVSRVLSRKSLHASVLYGETPLSSTLPGEFHFGFVHKTRHS